MVTHVYRASRQPSGVPISIRILTRQMMPCLGVPGTCRSAACRSPTSPPSGGGGVNDGILRLHTPATGVSSSGHTDFWREHDANVLPMPAGHTYRLSIRMRLSARDPKTSQTVYAGVGNNLIGWSREICLLTHEWQTFTIVFSTTQEAPASSVMAYIHLADNQPETWLEANDMTLIDTTSAARQIMHADWRTTDGSEHVINGASIFKQ